MMSLHLEYGGRSTRVGLYALPQLKPRQQAITRTVSGEMSNARLISGARKSSEGMSFEALLAGDPELDLTLAGTLIDADQVTTAYFDAKASERRPIGDFQDIDVVLDARGVEKSRRPHLKRSNNLDQLHPVKAGKRMPLEEMLMSFVVKSTLQVAHVDGLTFEFLKGIARELAEKQEVAVLGAGAKGNMPLVLREGGTAYRAFLAGETDGADRYKLLLLLSDQELKLPEMSA
jgi:hypothetical protein